MLTRSHRLTSSQVFAQTVRRGHRAGTRTLVLHLAVPATETGTPAQVGLVVGKAVGNAVKRNLVKRRLRDVACSRLGLLPGASTLVVRALPASAAASYAELSTDFDAALGRVARRYSVSGGST